MKKLLIPLYILIFFPSNDVVLAQGCCTAGSSTFGGLQRGIAGTGNLNVGLSFSINGLNRTYNERNQIPDPLNRTASVNNYNLEIEYGLTEKVSILAITGYNTKNRETTVRSNIDNSVEKINFDGQGISDVTILGKYELISPSILSQIGFTLGGGVKLPIGSYTKENNGTRLSIDLQPGTGATDVLLWGNFYKGFQPLNFAINANLFYRYAGVNLDGYRFGDEYIFLLNGEYYYSDFLTFTLGLRGRFSNEDYWGGRFLPSTGGTYYDVLPSLTYYEGSYSLKVFYQTPVYRNVRGIQLTTNSIIGAELLFSFSLIDN